MLVRESDRLLRLALAALGGLACVGQLGCAKQERAPYYGATAHGGQGGNSSVSLDTGGAPPASTENLCGNKLLRVLEERPNLYLVLDRSGSMTLPMDESQITSTLTKYQASLEAIHDVLFAIGHRTAYGAALFPALGSSNNCSTGSSIDAVTAGDSVTYARHDLDGPHLTSLMEAISRFEPDGGTPTSATLTRLIPLLTELEGKTSVILTTDGAPNCNDEASCDASLCLPNIEAAPRLTSGTCDSNYNCCASTAEYGPSSCIDESATLAPLAKLLDAGIKTYVIGLPGTEAYQGVMNAMARAGGAARQQILDTDPLYYRVEDAEELANTLKTIVASISITCTVELDEAPPDWSKVNVYFDNGLVLMNDKDGWQRVDQDTLELVGEQCELLKSGDVFQIQVVSGCATQVVL